MRKDRTPRELILRWVNIFNQADAARLADLYHEDAVNHQMPLEPVEGKEAIRAMFEREFAQHPMVCIPENVMADRDWGALEWRDPQGFRGAGFFQFQDELIILQRGYWDREGLKGSREGHSG
jgi:limonene-1,2-epoxide hydrolase